MSAAQNDVDLQQQQAQIAAMMAQLAPEQQAQIQEAVGNYNQQLAAQGIPQEHAQSYVWSYYTQCVTALYQQVGAAVAAAAAAAEAEAVAASSAPAAGGPAAGSAGDGGVAGSATTASAPVSAGGYTAAPDSAGAVATGQTASAQFSPEAAEAQRLEQEREAEARKKAEEDEEKKEQEQFQKKLESMDPVLAARFMKQREKQDAGDTSAIEVGSAAAPKKNIDPVLAKRWAAMQDRKESGDTAVDLVEKAQAAHKSSSSTAPANGGNSELAKKFKQRGEVAVDKLEEVATHGGGAKPWEEKRGSSELGKLLAKRKDAGEQEVTDIDSRLEAQAHEKQAKQPATELQKRLAAQQEKSRQKDGEGEVEEVGPVSNGEHKAAAETAQPSASAAERAQPSACPAAERREAVDASTAAERRHLRLKSGGTAVATFGWPSEGVSVDRVSWNIVVLEELTVDLEVFAILRPAAGGEDAKTTRVVLQKHARGTTFSGSCAPGHDRRILAAAAEATDSSLVVEKVVFSFSNAFSWFTAKDVELVTVVD
eukprot:TRINITY_DN17834_c0_g1_i1.p1 TRINITY_DN17834_c0_g1~~TRINITY_DN17834_c0_g1_i1.p1  ORF type:complete len:539 (+),score=205.04 TRINITY_DN17834_c0_g1_i1:134-1750(+)